MLAVYGFATIVVFLVLIMTKRLSVITALVLVPVAFAFIAGFDYKEIGAMVLTGIKQVAPTGILLMFAVLYFSVMLDAGLFDPVIAFIVRAVKGDPLKVVAGTAILTMIVHLDGDGTATFMIVLSTFLPIYKKLGMSRLILAGIVALSVGPMHLVPWSGTSVRAISTLNTKKLMSKRKPKPASTATWFRNWLVNFAPGLSVSSLKVQTLPASTNAAQRTIENNRSRYSSIVSNFISPG